MPDDYPTRWREHIEIYLGHGLSVIPMGSNKRPQVAWKEFQTRQPTKQEVLKWPREGIAIVTGAVSNIAVVDCESPEDTNWFWKNRGKTPLACKTRRGYHLYFQHPGEPVRNGVQIANRYDVRGDGGYVLAPPTPHKDGAYQWWAPKARSALERPPVIVTQKLPKFDPAWRPETAPANLSTKSIHDGEAYIAKIFAVAGQGGHDKTYQAACVLRQAGLSEAEAIVALLHWNKTNAVPPWSEKDLLHKLEDAYRAK